VLHSVTYTEPAKEEITLTTTTLTFRVEFEGVTMDDLRQIVANLDEQDSEPGEGIKPEHVGVLEVLHCWFAGDLGLLGASGTNRFGFVDNTVTTEWEQS